MSSEMKEYDPFWSPREDLFNRIVNLLDVSKKKLKLVEDGFKDRPDVHVDISDKIVKVSMYSLIKLMNSHPHFDYNKRFIFSDYRYKYLELESFKMSTETKKNYIKNLEVINKYVN